MKSAILVLTAAAVLLFAGQIVWADDEATTEPAAPAVAANTADDAASLRQQVIDMQGKMDALKEKLDTLDAIVTDPEGKMETVLSDVSKIKKFSWSGYLQARYESFNLDPDKGTAFNDGFMVRRARLKMTATPTERSQAVIEFDVASKMFSLKDGYLSYYFLKDWAITAGQFKWPFGYEIPYSSSKRETPEQALVFRRLLPGEYDLGAKITGPVGQYGVAQLALVNGAGVDPYNILVTATSTAGPITVTNGKVPQNVTGDFNDRKDVVANLAFNIGNAEFGASGYWGKGTWDSNRSNMSNKNTKNRYGADFRYYGSNWVFKTEYISGKGIDVPATNWNQNKTVSGGYAQFNYNFDVTNTLVARYSTINQDPGVTNDFGRRDAYEFGILHWLDSNNRVKLFYQMNGEERHSVSNNGYRAEWIITY